MADEGCCCHKNDQEPAKESTHPGHAASNHDCCSDPQAEGDPRYEIHGKERTPG